VPTVADLTAWLRAAGFTGVRTERRPQTTTVVWLVAI
jgi:hypothetical protein